MPAGYTPFATSPAQDVVLSQIADAAAQAPEGAVGIFDLDGCLFDNRPRQVQIMRELASREGLHTLHALTPAHITDWQIQNTLRALGLDEGRIEVVLPRAIAAFSAHFLSGDYVRYDHAMPGAAGMVRRCHGQGMHVVYLTGRHEEMRAGTASSLERFGFPVGEDRATLICKPTRREPDDRYKRSALAHIDALGMPVLLMDNEPRHVNHFRERYPEALVVFVDTDHSPLPDRPHPALSRICGFLRTNA